MILAIDIGNTHTEVGIFREETLLQSWRIGTGMHRTEDELIVFITQFLGQKQLALKDIHGLAIASVVPNMTQIFLKMSQKYFSIEPLLVDDTIDLGIKINYEPPSNVGADRLCNAVGAFTKYGGSVLVVDFGTATTLDVVDKGGAYIGGAITQGLESAALSLYEKTSKLPKIPLKFPEHVIGNRTDLSMQAGIMYGSVKMIDGLIELFKKELMDEPNVIATGGLASVISKKSQYIQYLEPDLVLQGLKIIYDRNKK